MLLSELNLTPYGSFDRSQHIIAFAFVIPNSLFKLQEFLTDPFLAASAKAAKL
ncbi:hypothetical protein LEP1GSC193_3600 [Leptospira alstonii serovar Pingchang str. 80-412]|uniref:Uncharacterized protein n=1 Tax=Leptospira alstonii serovar Pingchang str. 80-412 TaxID=1218564 RepID=T0G521_9LEPT|nr:hypothetical protein LEP1GSC193_3600 [Leptospira alstonii serovar Pingchang str. 80-412]